ncbi:hypothetical protein JCM8547_007905 [Rhodosporidiobolus lusitaniae]
MLLPPLPLSGPRDHPSYDERQAQARKRRRQAVLELHSVEKGGRDEYDDDMASLEDSSSSSDINSDDGGSSDDDPAPRRRERRRRAGTATSNSQYMAWAAIGIGVLGCIVLAYYLYSGSSTSSSSKSSSSTMDETTTQTVQSSTAKTTAANTAATSTATGMSESASGFLAGGGGTSATSGGSGGEKTSQGGGEPGGSATSGASGSTSSSSSSSGSGTTYTGEATFYYGRSLPSPSAVLLLTDVVAHVQQGGVAGACNNTNPDTAMICALASTIYDSSLCGTTVKLTRTDGAGGDIEVTVADRCPGCGDNGDGYIDLSESAYLKLGTIDEGTFPVSWFFTS